MPIISLLEIAGFKGPNERISSATAEVTPSSIEVKIVFDLPLISQEEKDQLRQKIDPNASPDENKEQYFIAVETRNTENFNKMYNDWLGNSIIGGSVTSSIKKGLESSPADQTNFEQLNPNIAWQRVIGNLHELLKNSFDAVNVATTEYDTDRTQLEITMSLTKTGDDFVMSFSDTGAGFPQIAEPGVEKSYEELFSEEKRGISEKAHGRFLGGGGFGVRQFADGIKADDGLEHADLFDPDARITCSNLVGGGACIKIYSNVMERSIDAQIAYQLPSSLSEATASTSHQTAMPQVPPSMPISAEPEFKLGGGLIERRAAKRKREDENKSTADTSLTASTSLTMSSGSTTNTTSATNKPSILGFNLQVHHLSITTTANTIATTENINNTSTDLTTDQQEQPSKTPKTPTSSS